MYSIQDVAKLLDVSRESLRRWERTNQLTKVSRTPTGWRQYSDSDVLAIKVWLERRGVERYEKSS